MDKIKIEGLVVVEGKSDIDYLSSFIDAKFYSVNGSAVNDKDINFIKKVSKKERIIVLTDPDFPGKKIRNIINDNVENVYNAYVRKEYSIYKNKVGVAECDKTEVLRALENLKNYNSTTTSNLTYNDLYDLKLIGYDNSKQLRDTICDELVIEHSNGKSFYKKIKILGYTKEDLKEILINAQRKRN